MNTARVLALVSCVFATAILGSCSLVLDDLNATCTPAPGKREDCHALNVANHLDDESGGDCFIFQCRKDGRGCEKRARDEDYDGFVDRLTCEKTGLKAKFDCDDSTELRYPDNPEVCDTVDNNCNDAINEGILGSELEMPSKLEAPPVVDTLNFSDQGGRLRVAMTTDVGSDGRTVLRVIQDENALVSPLQEESGQNCTKQGYDAHCTLREIALGTSSDALIALGIQTKGCAAGTVRVASRALGGGDDAPRWDGDSSMMSNLKEGVILEPDCPQAPGGARAPSLAIAPPAGGTASALGLWRASSGAAPGELMGLGLRIDSKSAAPTVNAIDAPTPFSLSGPELGFDAAAVRSWQGKFLVAYDVDTGLEIALISNLQAGVAQAFEAAQRLPISRPGARHVALAAAQPATSEQGEGLAIAWRVADGLGWTIHFAPISRSSAGTLAVDDTVDDLILVSGARVTEGPLLVYTARGFAEGPEGPSGGWFIAWTEAEGALSKLVGARIKSSGDAVLEDPFTLIEDKALQHPFAYATSDQDFGYGVISGSDPQQLNIGSLTCGRYGR